MTDRGRPAIFICRHGEREDYQWKARGESWQQQAERPWDTPLTPGGIAQGAAVGRAIAAHTNRLGLAPVQMVLTSPFLRCAQTAAAAAAPLGLEEVGVTTALSEAMSESWYRSWGVPGADSTWGGPAGCTAGTPVDKLALHPAAFEPAGSLLLGHAALGSLLSEGAPAHAGSVRVTPHAPGLGPCASPTLSYKWGGFETHDQLATRMAGLCEGIRDRGFQATVGGAPCSVLLVSHGGPTTGLYRTLTGHGRSPSTGYTGLFCYAALDKAVEEGAGAGAPESGGDARWECLLCADHEHLKEVGAPISGPCDMVEQAPTAANLAAEM